MTQNLFTKSDSQSSNRVVVAMSGGVDSSVAALLLKEQGHDLVGVSMQVWDYRGSGGSESRATCCAPSDFNDARRVAARIGVPYYVFDFERVFQEQVISRFVESYQRGLTPNPCIDCNNKVKFRELRSRALSFGGTHVATGHYARIVHDERGASLLRGKDAAKDQSYFLYGLTPEELRSTMFPVGALTKAEVRDAARRAGLVTADKEESQDICFVSGSVRDFVAGRGGSSKDGLIVDRAGKVLGTHSGIHGFTVGQRKGLGIGGRAGVEEEPLYVIEINPENNSIVAGPKAELERSEFTVVEVNWQDPEVLGAISHGESIEVSCIAQLRYRHRGVPVTVRISPNIVASSNDREDAPQHLTVQQREVRVLFEGEWSAVSPGQAAVFYDSANERVLGGGRIAPEARDQHRYEAERKPRALAVLNG